MGEAKRKAATREKYPRMIVVTKTGPVLLLPNGYVRRLSVGARIQDKELVEAVHQHARQQTSRIIQPQDSPLIVRPK
jgi:hypothetical protein